MVTHTHRPLRVVVYEGKGSIPLPAASRSMVMAALLDKGYAVTRVTRERNAPLHCDNHTLLVLGSFEGGAPALEDGVGTVSIETRDIT